MLRNVRKRLKVKKITLKQALVALVALCAIGIVIAGAVMFVIINSLPTPDLIEHRQVAQSTKIYDRTGEVLLYELYGDEQRTVVSLDQIPDAVKHATIAAEDANFYEHAAFDVKGIIRAFFKNIASGEILQGGSTITQQLAKKAFLTDDRTITRKLRELVLAIVLERRFTKDQILELYLNQIPYGGNAYGIEAASQAFFAKPANGLSVAQAALLASLTKAPSYYSPWGSHVDELLNRQKTTLKRMRELGYIDEKEFQDAMAEDMVFTKPDRGIRAPHFSLMVADYLMQRYGEDFVRTSGLTVRTTLDWSLQQIAEKAVEEGAARNSELYEGRNAALVAADPQTGQILALVGSKDYFADPEPDECIPGSTCKFDGKFNVAIQGLRQPGSALKPFVYLTAFAKGYTPDTMVMDLPTEFSQKRDTCPLINIDYEADKPECFHPHNYDEYFRGPTSLRNALAQSINIPAVKMLYLAGVDDSLETLANFGITTLTERSRYGLSLVLGGGEVTLAELVGAYGVLAQDGIHHQQAFILSVGDGASTLEQYRDNSSRVMNTRPVQLINNVLADKDARSPLFSNSLSLTMVDDHEIALKTGTTNDYRDAWAIGYTPTLVTGVWAGNNDNTPMQRKGGSILAAVPIWHAFMSKALGATSTPPFTNPEEEPQITKPMLGGSYVATYKANNQLFPQVHDILFYVDPKDPTGPLPAYPAGDAQFENWEVPTLAWVTNQFPVSANINAPLPPGAELVTGGGTVSLSDKLSLNILAPQKGTFIESPLTINASISAEKSIKQIVIKFNETIIDTLTGSFTSPFTYHKTLFIPSINLQNVLKISATDEGGREVEQTVIVFKK